MGGETRRSLTCRALRSIKYYIIAFSNCCISRDVINGSPGAEVRHAAFVEL